MAIFSLPNTITKEDLLPFDLFPVIDSTLARKIVPIRNLETSQAIQNLILRNIGWKGYAYKDVDNVTKIGYNLTDGIDSLGLTEEQAFNKWIKEFKGKIARRLEDHLNQLSGIEKRLHAVSPYSILDRGYSIVTNSNQEIIKNVDQAKPSEKLSVKLSDGELSVEVSK